MSEFRDVIARALSASGVLTEFVEPDGVETLTPDAMRKILDLPEFARLGFGSELPNGAVRVTPESGLVDRLETFISTRGMWLEGLVKPAVFASAPSEPEHLVQKRLVLDNGTFRLAGVDKTLTRYLFFLFNMTAVSDEKREETLLVGINESNQARADHLAGPLLDFLATVGDRLDAPAKVLCEQQPWTAKQAQDWCMRCLPALVRSQLSPFLSGMERRMTNDMDRLYAYYTDIRNEAWTRATTKHRKNKDLKTDSGNAEQLKLRLDAANREYLAKVADLTRKYEMSVEIKLIQAVRLAFPVSRINIQLMRRKGTRRYNLDWNPLSKQLDDVCCEACGSLAKSFHLCDDHLHIICPACFADCHSCRKPYCRGCHPKQCPKCGAKR